MIDAKKPARKLSSFERRLDKASLVEAYVSAWLARQGLMVTHYPIYAHKDFNREQPDLCAWPEEWPNAGRYSQVEVKGCQEHGKEEVVFVCSQASWMHKYGESKFFSVPYVLVDRRGNMKCFMPGARAYAGTHYDGMRNQEFKAMFGAIEDRKDIGILVDWLKDGCQKKASG